MTEFLRSRKGKIIIISASVVLAAAIVLIILLLAGGETGYRNISVSKIFGNVIAENNGNEYEAYENMRLADGYALNTDTDSYTRLSLDDDKYMKLEQESRAEFRNVGDAKSHVTAIYLDHGALTAELVNPLAEEESFVVNTPNAVLAVRGTFFRIEVSFDETGDAFTDVYTYGGAVACQRIMPDGTVVDEEVAVRAGYKACIKMDEIITVYVEEFIDYEPGDDVDPIDVDKISDSDIVDMYNASYHGHSMFLETGELWQEILDRDIDIEEYYSVYDMGEIEEYTVTSGEEPTESSTAVPESADTITTTAATTAAVVETTTESTSAAAEHTTTVSTERTDVSDTVTVPSVTSATTTVSVTEEATVTVPSVTSEPEKTTGTGTSATVPEVTSEPEETTATGTSASETEITTVTVPDVTSIPEETSESSSSVSVPEISSEPEESTVNSSSVYEPEPEESSESSSSEPEPEESSSSSSSSEPEPEVPDGIPVDEEHFPDPVFREYVSKNFDSDKDGYLSDDEIAKANQIAVEGFYSRDGGVASLKGIEYLTELTILNCTYNSGITSIDVSKNTKLTNLVCGLTQISSLDVSQNTELIVLSCSSSNLTYIDISNNPLITTFNVSNCKYPIPINATIYATNNDPNFANFDIGRVSNLKNAKIDELGNFYDITGDVTYTYDCGQGKSETFTLTRTGDPVEPDGIAIDDTNFPDPVFREYVSENFDWDSNGYLSEEEITNITYINVLGYYYGGDYGITSLEGIEYFTELQTLYCSYNPGLTSLDVSSNTKLLDLEFDDTEVESLDVSNNLALSHLSFSNTPMRSLILGDNEVLYYLHCTETELISLDLSKCTELTELWCHNSPIEYLDISNSTKLDWLSCYNMEITSIDVSNNIQLTRFDCFNNSITSLDVSNNTALEVFDCSYTLIDSLDVRSNTALTALTFNNTNVSSIDLSNNAALKTLNCYNTLISSLDLSSNPKMGYLQCYNIPLTSLDVSGNTELYNLNCSNTLITSLDVSENPALKTLKCGGCNLAYVDISNNPLITTFDASGNTHPIPSNATFYDVENDPNFAGFDPSRVSNLEGAEIDQYSGNFFNITSDTITYTYDCGKGYSETFTLVRTSSYSLTAPTHDISNQLLESLLPPDLTLLEGYAAPDTDGIADIKDDQESSGCDLDISDPSEGLVTDEGQTAPDTDGLADLIEDAGGNPPDSGDEPVEAVLALARGQPP